MSRGGARTGAGRPKKPAVELTATKGIATEVLSTVDEVALWRFLLHADELADPEKRKLLTDREREQIKDAAEYLTNRRDGKPAIGVFVGDTRERARELDFGDLPDLVQQPTLGDHRKPN